MTRPFIPAKSRALEYPAQPRPAPWTVRPEPQRIDLRGVRTRRYEVMWLDADGLVADAVRVAPALPPFEAAVSAVRQGTLFNTPNGPRAVEDLLPGDQVETVGHGFDTVTWIGAMTAFVSANANTMENPLLTRVTADAFGIGRPMPDLVLGPGARLLQRLPACAELFGTDGALMPAASFVDGSSVVGLRPQSPVKVFHMAFERHRIIRANGVEIESFHPGNLTEARMARELLSFYLTLFPHVRSLDAFGAAVYPQLSVEDANVVLRA